MGKICIGTGKRINIPTTDNQFGWRMWDSNPGWHARITIACMLAHWWLYALGRLEFYKTHYGDVMMGAIASQITSLTIVYSTVLFRRKSKKTSKLRLTGLCAGNSPGTGEFPAQMASNEENVSIWWRHHEATPRQGQSDWASQLYACSMCGHLMFEMLLLLYFAGVYTFCGRHTLAQGNETTSYTT